MDCESWCVLSDDELARRDVAETNLAAAFGLPGAEQMNLGACRRRLDEWAEVVRERTNKWWPRFLSQPEAFSDSPGQFRMLALVSVLQRELGVHYEPLLIHGVCDYSDCRPWFVLGPVTGCGGTCTSLPVLYLAIGRRLGYPLKLVETKEHYFVRWDEPGGERFNVEGAGNGFSSYPDAHYLKWPCLVDERMRRDCHLLKSLTPREELAAFLELRGAVWRDNLQFDLAGEAYFFARRLDPTHARHQSALAVNTIMQRIDDHLPCSGWSLEEPLEAGLRLATPPPVEAWEKWATPVAQRELLRILRNRRDKQATSTHAAIFASAAGDDDLT